MSTRLAPLYCAHPLCPGNGRHPFCGPLQHLPMVPMRINRLGEPRRPEWSEGSLAVIAAAAIAARTPIADPSVDLVRHLTLELEEAQRDVHPDPHLAPILLDATALGVLSTSWAFPWHVPTVGCRCHACALRALRGGVLDSAFGRDLALEILRLTLAAAGVRGLHDIRNAEPSMVVQHERTQLLAFVYQHGPLAIQRWQEGVRDLDNRDARDALARLPSPNAPA